MEVWTCRLVYVVGAERKGAKNHPRERRALLNPNRESEQESQAGNPSAPLGKDSEGKGKGIPEEVSRKDRENKDATLF